MISTDQLALGVLGVSLPTFFLLRYVITAPYGKHKSSSQYFGPAINARLGWMIFESPNLALVAWFLTNRDETIFGKANATLLFMFTIHYINRSIIYPMRMSKSSRPVPLAVVASGFSYCMVNGYLQSATLCWQQEYPPGYTYIQSFRFILGTATFFLGLGINLHSDGILRSLCKQRDSSTSNEYLIPRGGVFEFVSCANYTGEILEWAGYAVASNNLAALSFFVFTCSNLIPRALSHHEWYLQKFDDYPLNRRAVLPFIL